MEYRTPKERSEARFIEKKSEFIGYISPAQTEEQAVAFIEEIRAQHRKATHNCYAYILRENNTARHSDDGEPSGTAGVPIYEVLRKEGLTDVCCVVTRYFGGVLLGAGGLVRAYTRAAKDAVTSAEIMNMADAEKLLITVDYGLYGKLAQIFADFDVRVQNEDFADNVKITLYVRAENSGELKAKLVDSCSGNILVESLQSESFDFA